MKVCKCNICGKIFDEFDEQENFGFHSQIGYGSKYDGEVINLDFCCNCFDKILDNIITKCKINPIETEIY